jgi:hypothetical protein
MTGPTTTDTTPTRSTATPGAASVDLTLAHLHLRLGSIALARAELETLAGRDALDASGLTDLAEVRWRTGDLAGAGEAAAAVLPDGDGPVIALVIAAEAALGRGRPTEARRYATKAMAAAPDQIDAMFAGMPRGPVWPADPVAVIPTSPTLFGGAAGADAPHPGDEGSVDGPPLAPVAGPIVDGPISADESPTLAIWASDDLRAAAPEPGISEQPDPATSLPTGDVALRAGRQALESGEIDDAVILLSLALRLAPPLAPGVLDAIDGRPERSLALVRGDAYRLVGREGEARLAFADAARPADGQDIPADPRPEDERPHDERPQDPPLEGDPA